MAKHIPRRTCIGCRNVTNKRELIRLVRTPEGAVIADPTGKKNGRGTYVHKSRECFQAVIGAPGTLKHALKLESALAPTDLQALIELAKTFPAHDATETEMKGTPTEPRRAPNQAAHQIK
ncbi:MAG: YlxR family protein [Anaerolineae bacterium]|nr:YlxR family protein [Anaerolineae bacterium]